MAARSGATQLAAGQDRLGLLESLLLAGLLAHEIQNVHGCCCRAPAPVA